MTLIFLIRKIIYKHVIKWQGFDIKIIFLDLQKIEKI